MWLVGEANGKELCFWWRGDNGGNSWEFFMSTRRERGRHVIRRIDESRPTRRIYALRIFLALHDLVCNLISIYRFSSNKFFFYFSYVTF